MLLAAFAALLAAGGARANEQTITLQTRPGVTDAFLYIAVDNPKASVILFAGGPGVVNGGNNNFLVRTRSSYPPQGIAVATIDAPSDHTSGMNPDFRASAEHGQDIAAVVAFLKSKSPAPVWLIGTSRGSISAANGAARIGAPQIAGVVLTSSVWTGGMSYIPLDRIAVPTLIVHNRDDACPEAPFIGAQQALPKFTNAHPVELIAVSGGVSKSDRCQALAPHGYYQIEDQVIPPIIAWIKAHPPAR